MWVKGSPSGHLSAIHHWRRAPTGKRRVSGREAVEGNMLNGSAFAVLLLLPCVSNPQIADKDLAALVEKLGGKVRQEPGIDDRPTYEVDLKGTKTSDNDLAALSNAKDIWALDLSFAGITDKGIAHLVSVRDLFRLNLNGTKVTDDAIQHLRQVPNLHFVELAQTTVTDQGVAQLVKGRPLIQVCKVSLGPKAQFRVHHLYRDGELVSNLLMIGDTHFGTYVAGKKLTPGEGPPLDRRRLATAYYHRHGPIGQVLAKLEWFKPASLLDYPSDVRLPGSLVGLLAPAPAPLGSLPMGGLVDLWSEPAIGAIRLNVGTFAAYGRPGQHIDFYNSTPEIESFSLPAEGQHVYFGFVQDALVRGCCIKVIKGPERVMAGKNGPRSYYSALFIEIARNDLRDIDTDLLTKESLAEMMANLTETGVLCFHTSHRYHNLKPPIIDAAKSLNLAWKVGNEPGYYVRSAFHLGSEWVVVARKAEYLRHLVDVKTDQQKLEWSVPASTGQHLWRDGQPHDLKPLAYPSK
jgi:hypothetical protein